MLPKTLKSKNENALLKTPKKIDSETWDEKVNLSKKKFEKNLINTGDKAFIPLKNKSSSKKSLFRSIKIKLFRKNKFKIL